MSEAIYIPANADLARVLNGLPSKLQKYREHAMVLLHFIATKRWGKEVEPGGFAQLHSAILRGYIPNAVLGPLKRHLVRAGTIFTTPHSAGVRSTGYRVRPEFDGPPRRVILNDPRLIRKRRAWREAYSPPVNPAPNEVIERRRHVLEHMRDDLARLSLAKPISRILRDLERTDVDPDHACYVCSAISHGDHAGVKVDCFGLRVHSIVTRTDTEIRRYLRIDGRPLIELDIANSQPLILAIALKSPGAWTTYITRGQHIGEGIAGTRPLMFLPVADEETRRLVRLCEEGLLYEFLMQEANLSEREQAKQLLFRDVLFGRPCVNGPVTEVFGRHWPTCLEVIRKLKREHGYRIVAKMLQRLESAIIIDGVCGRLVREQPGTSFLTIHDSALAVADSSDIVRRIMREEFEKLGIRPTIREKNRFVLDARTDTR